MPRDQDKLAIDDSRWQVAVAREAVIRPLINAGQLSPIDVATACRILGLRRSRLYALIEQYRSAPVTSSLAATRPGPKKGARRLSVEVEAVIEEAIRDKYLTWQKASVSTLHDHIRHICRERELDIPSWKAVRARVEQIDRFKLVRQREGNKAARDRLRPVPEEYRADHALLTLGEHRLAQAALRQRGVRLSDEQLIFDTVEAQRELLETSASITKSARRQVARRARSLNAAAQGAATDVVTPDLKQEPETLSVLAVEEWS